MKIVLTLLISVAVIFSVRKCRDLKPNSEVHKADTLNWITTSKGSIHIKTFKNVTHPDSLRLVFVIHGDAPFNKPGYHYRMAEKIANQNKNTIAIGILRPGYTDPDNNTSNGIKGLTTGDNYTPDVIDAIAEVITQLKKQYRPIKTMLVGHSGGSAITGDIIGLKPDLLNVAVLVACPCNVPEWRKYMGKKQVLNTTWSAEVKSISPLDVAKNINDSTEVILVIGEKDDVTPISLSEEYYKQLKSFNKKSKFISIPNEGHEILLHEKVLSEIKNALH